MGDQVQLTSDYSGIKTGKILVKSMLHFFFLFRKYLIMTVTFCIKGIGKAKLRKPLADLLHLFHLWFFHSFRHAYNTLSLVFTLWPFPLPVFLTLTPFFPACLSFTSSLLSLWGPELNWVACRSMEGLRKGYPVPQGISNAISPLGRVPEELVPYSLYVETQSAGISGEQLLCAWMSVLSIHWLL